MHLGHKETLTPPPESFGIVKRHIRLGEKIARINTGFDSDRYPSTDLNEQCLRAHVEGTRNDIQDPVSDIGNN